MFRPVLTALMLGLSLLALSRWSAAALPVGAVVGTLPDGRVLLPTNQLLSDPRSIGIRRRFVSGLPGQNRADRPVDLALSRDGQTLAVETNYGIAVMPAGEEGEAQFFPSTAGNIAGVAFSADGKRIYAPALVENAVRVLRRGAARWFDDATERITLPAGSAPSGLAISADGHRLYAAISDDRNHLGSLAVIDLPSRRLAANVPVGSYPFGVTLARDGKRVYVSNRGGRAPRPGDPLQVTSPGWPAAFPIVVDPSTGIAAEGSVSIVDAETLHPRAEIRTGRLPGLMALSPDGDSLYVPNANDDTVSVIDTRRERVTCSLSVRPRPDLPFSSGPNAVAASPDGRALYVANGGNNAVAVCEADRRGLRLRGFVPVDWYPCALAMSPNSRLLYVLNNKGVGSQGPVVRGAPHPGEVRHLKDHTGTLSLLAVPDAAPLARMTAAVAANNSVEEALAARREARRGAAPAVIPERAGEPTPIRTVFYVIKENQSYDAILGDLHDAAGRRHGNGNAALAIFGDRSDGSRGASITPNHHELARRFVTLDNFYDCPSRSADGHQWMLEAYDVDTTEREQTELLRSDPSEGTLPTGYASSGFLWDLCRRHGVSFRVYGEYLKYKANGAYLDHLRDHREGTNRFPTRNISPINGLREGRDYPIDYAGWGLEIPDQNRVDAFAREFAAMVAGRRPLPRLCIIYLPNDHGSGTGDPTRPTPRAAVADNDLALGRLIDLISNSRFWRQSATFVCEDDTQNDPDHVEGHRTTALCISPYTRRSVVDSSYYTQVSMVATIERILGLPPMTQIDAVAAPMANAFIRLGRGEQPDFSPALPDGPLVPSVPLDEMNPPRSALRGAARLWAERSARENWSQPDAVDEDVMQRINWYSVRGCAQPYPGDPSATYLPK